MTVKNSILQANNWLQFKDQIKNLSTKEKGDAFELLTKYYLKIEPRYATKLKHVWLLNEVSEKLKKHLNLMDRDMGIDLVAETHSGEFWAIQCKYRDNEEQSITWREISTFIGLAFGRCQNFSFGLICTTTERFTSVLANQERIGFCSSDVWQDLDETIFKQIHETLENMPVELVPLQPRPHQQAAVENAIKHYLENNETRGKLIMPCGSGKSLAAYWIADALKAKNIIIAVPSLALIQQTLNVWLRESLAHKKNINWLCICSDETAGNVTKDDIVVHTQDLGIPCLTNTEEIAKRLTEKNENQTIIFTTYQSGKTIAEAAKKTDFIFDLGIMDESHKTVGQKDKLFSYLLHEENIQIGKRVFMTATERRYLGQSEEVVSMDNVKIYGETFHLMTFKDALEIQPPILCDYKILTMVVGKKEIAEMISGNLFVKPDRGKWNDEVEAEMLASAVALRKAMQKYPITHAVSFHSSIDKAKVFRQNQDILTETFNFGKLDTFHVSGNTPTAVRERQLRDFANSSKSLITNARCLTEGVDVPGIDCVLFADPRKSTIDIVQAAGRALRPAKGKEFGYIVVPILVDENLSKEELLESGAFDAVIATLRSLASNDDRIVEYFRAIINGKVRKSGGSVDFDIDEKIAQKIDLEEFSKAIEIKCWNKLAKLSWRSFEETREFARNLKLSGREEWKLFCLGKMPEKGKKPSDIPTAINDVFKNVGWISWGDFLGTGNIRKGSTEWLSFDEARKYIHTLKLKSQNEWRMYCRGEILEKDEKPYNIPTIPDRVYKKQGWIDWVDWLGKEKKHWLPYEKARDFARTLNLGSMKDWMDFCHGKMPEKGKKPSNIPYSPASRYKNRGWISWGDFLGTGKVDYKKFNWMPFEDARVFVRGLNLKGQVEWKNYCLGKMPEKGVKPFNIPSGPNEVYKKKGWISYYDWLGKEEMHWLTYNKAKEFARSLKLKSYVEWKEFCKNKIPEKGILPLNIPLAPHETYKNKGWTNWNDWLGKNK